MAACASSSCVLRLGALLLCLCLALALAPLPCRSTDHIVGAGYGWQPPQDPGPQVNLNYTVWAKSQTFYLGDEVSFHYQEHMQYSVYQVNFSVYTNCTISMYSGNDWIYNWTNRGGKTVVPLNQTMVYYFVDANHCTLGMKVPINVTVNASLAENATKGTPASDKNSSSSKSSNAGSLATGAMHFSTLLLLQVLLLSCVHLLYPTL